MSKLAPEEMTACPSCGDLTFNTGDCFHCLAIAQSKTDPAHQLFELNDDTREILGKPNFWCGPLAHKLRDAGHDIARKAEDEQAAVIYWLLGFYFKHGSQWRQFAGEALKEILESDVGKKEAAHA